MSRILVADDDKDMLALTERWLLREGYTVDTAVSGGEALDKLSGIRPDLILLDYRMPGMDGLQTLERIREDESNRDIPVIIRTGDGELAGNEKALQGAYAVVPKSLGKPGLLNEVSQALR